MKKIIYFLVIISLFVGCETEGGDESGDEKTESIFGSIYGVVTDKTTAEPMRATGVELYVEEVHYPSNTYSLLTRTVTYDDGHYEFKELKAGNYKLTVMADGYETVNYKVVVEENRVAKGDMQLDKLKTNMTVRTLDITDINGNSATLNGSVSYATYYSPNERGFVYATHSDPINGGTKVTASSDFVTTITNLSKATYYVQAYATNDNGTEYGEERNFQVTGMPSVTTLAATNVAATTATLNGMIDYQGDPPYTERGFVYSNSFQNPTIEDDANSTTKRTVSGTSVDFSANVSGLTTEKTYYVRAYITNPNGTVYGESVSFKATSKDYIVLSSYGIAVQLTDISSGTDCGSAKSICGASRVGGYSDWRLPTIGELSILYTNKTEIGGFKATTNGSKYWSSTVYDSYNGRYYYYNFYNGSQTYAYNFNTYNVRAVRTLP
jgi:uncharacterized protein (DUF2141 family)